MSVPGEKEEALREKGEERKQSGKSRRPAPPSSVQGVTIEE